MFQASAFAIPERLSDNQDLNQTDSANKSQIWVFERVLLPHLETIYVGQVTFLRPAEVAMLALEPRLKTLRRVRVVDAYGGNIWGPRVRIGDVEAALVSALRRSTGSEEDESNYIHVEEVVLNGYLERIRSLVSCEALTERIIGGDRMDNKA